MEPLTGKVAIVTGAAQGIGRAIAERFARAGAHVTVADVNDARGAEVAEVVAAAGGDARFVHCDVALTADVDRLVDQTVGAFGGVDILVNNAAIASYKLLVDTSDDEWDRVIAVNLRGLFLTSRRCIPRDEGGRAPNWLLLDSNGDPGGRSLQRRVVPITGPSGKRLKSRSRQALRIIHHRHMKYRMFTREE